MWLVLDSVLPRVVVVRCCAELVVGLLNSLCLWLSHLCFLLNTICVRHAFFKKEIIKVEGKKIKVEPRLKSELL
jgi:hypothetical protein